ncbi:Zinc finger protein 700 [Eumeta japonica]|uniref:Zinc finger protein 700 n=1 Tax=Eumeta variegata TaxID=151549 RepID=A0A4C1ZY10_EUMVA|nr:Zinc finger protein 700 [Eumeta japonica]
MTMMVKVEFEGEDSAAYQEPRVYIKHAHLSEDSDTDDGLRVKEENSLILKIKDEADEIAIKQELEIEPTMLQPKTTPTTDIDDLTGSMNYTRSISMQTNPPDTQPSSLGGRPGPAATPLRYCTDCLSNRSSHNPKWKSHHGGDSGAVSHSDFLLDVRRGRDCYQSSLREQTSGHSDSVDTSLYRQESGQCRRCVRASTESDCTADSIKTAADMHTSKKQNECKRCEHNTGRELCSIKHTNITRTHTGINSYETKQSASDTPKAGSFEILTHLGENLYRCEHCDYSSSKIRNLKRHMRTHSGVKPYKCRHCDYRTSQTWNLKVHMRTHTGEKPFKCEHCEYSASLLYHLKLHMRTHTGEKPYGCKHCEYSS